MATGLEQTTQGHTHSDSTPTTSGKVTYDAEELAAKEHTQSGTPSGLTAPAAAKAIDDAERPATEKRKNKSHDRRKESRKRLKLAETPWGYQAQVRSEEKFVKGAPKVEVDFQAEDFPSNAGGFTAPPQPGLKRAFSLEELVGERSKYRFHLQKWTGQYVV